MTSGTMRNERARRPFRRMGMIDDIDSSAVSAGVKHRGLVSKQESARGPEKLLIYVQVAFHHTCHRELPTDPDPAGFSHSSEADRVVKETVDRGGQGLRILGRDQRSRLPIYDDLGTVIAAHYVQCDIDHVGVIYSQANYKAPARQFAV